VRKINDPDFDPYRFFVLYFFQKIRTHGLYWWVGLYTAYMLHTHYFSPDSVCC
jgi:hypothetical protein